MSTFAVNGFNSRRFANAADKSEATRELFIEELKARPGAAEAGVTDEGLANVRRHFQTMGHDRAPTAEGAGVAGPALVRGERMELVSEHTNAHGERVLEAWQRNGPHFNKVRITEAQAGEHTRIVTSVRGHR